MSASSLCGLGLVMLAGCGGAPPSTPPTVPSNRTGEVAPPQTRARYVGTPIGFEISHHAFTTGTESTVRLPDELRKVSVLTTYPSPETSQAFVLARRNRELVVLVATDGVVTDDHALALATDAPHLVYECNEDTRVAIVDESSCRDGAITSPALAAWNVDGGSLIPLAGPRACECWWYVPEEP